MKKTLYIGRDPQADIVILDSRDVVSRCHAVLHIDGRKMLIEDKSKNGTYINGVRINQGTLVPVTRKDTVSLAHVAELDWSKVPNTSRKIWIIAIIAFIVASLAVLAYFQREPIKNFFKCEPQYVTDTLRVKDTVTIHKTIEKIIVKETTKEAEVKEVKETQPEQKPEQKPEPEETNTVAPIF